MSMSTRVVAIRPADSVWHRMKTVFDACMVAGVSVPSEVREFFDGRTPDPVGVVVEIECTPAVREWRDDMSLGFEVLLDELPDNVKVIRFFNSY